MNRFKITPSSFQVNEGASINTSIETDFAPGTTLFYKVVGRDVNKKDFAAGFVKEKVQVNANGVASIAHTLKADSHLPVICRNSFIYLLVGILFYAGPAFSQILQGRCDQFDEPSPQLGGGRLARAKGGSNQTFAWIRENDGSDISCRFAWPNVHAGIEGDWLCGKYYYDISGTSQTYTAIYDRNGQPWIYTAAKAITIPEVCEVFPSEGRAEWRTGHEAWYKESYNDKRLYTRVLNVYHYSLINPSF